jgi:hypothetical protein
MRLTLVAALALASAGIATAAPSPSSPTRPAARPAPRAAHPDVGRDQDCIRCHAQQTPESFAAWRQGKHGLDLVTCVVCHGSTGADFRLRPATDRCQGCHADQHAALSTPFMKGKTCFTCHPGHALDPHAARREQTTAARLNADVELRRELQAAGPVNGPNLAAEAAAKAPVSTAPGSAPAPGAAPQASPGPAQPAAAPKDLGTAQPHPPTEKP